MFPCSTSMGTSSRGGIEIIVNPASLEIACRFAHVGTVPATRWPVTLGWRPYSRPLACFFYFWLFFRSYSADPRHKPESQRKTTPIKVIPDFFWQQSHLGNKVISAGVVQHPRDMLTTRDGAVIHLRPVNSRGSGVQAPVRPHVLSAEGAQASPS